MRGRILKVAAACGLAASALVVPASSAPGLGETSVSGCSTLVDGNYCDFSATGRTAQVVAASANWAVWVRPAPPNEDCAAGPPSGAVRTSPGVVEIETIAHVVYCVAALDKGAVSAGSISP